MSRISEVQFANTFVGQFPGDDSGALHSRQTPGMFYSRANPTPVKEPRLLAWSQEMAAELGLDLPVDRSDIAILGGNSVLPSMKPYAACYAGHQFGNWAGQLGDGRAITLGELINPKGVTFEIQLKGAGPTPYSRRADGRAVLRSSVREYLMSEAMHHLGIPTTRALALVATGDEVLRDMFYNGDPAYEPGAIVTRVAPTFLRFGNYELLAARQENGNLKDLVQWTMDRYFPHITGEGRMIQWFQEVVDRTAALMVHWMRVGFVHGVMNTDNMSILGLTIDYGPYSFLDDLDMNFTPNTTDLPGRRYAFGRQPSIAQWNIGCLAGAISPLLSDTSELLSILENYRVTFTTQYQVMMANKFGFDAFRPEDLKLLSHTEQVLGTIRPDMTIFYQLLMELPETAIEGPAIMAHFDPSFYNALDTVQGTMFTGLIQQYQRRRSTNTIPLERSMAVMKRTNPRIILRNYMLHQAIEELENGSAILFNKLHLALKTPYARSHEELVAKRPDWATTKAGCSMLSCSS